jgi:hypothetical protein
MRDFFKINIFLKTKQTTHRKQDDDMASSVGQLLRVFIDSSPVDHLLVTGQYVWAGKKITIPTTDHHSPHRMHGN